MTAETQGRSQPHAANRRRGGGGHASGLSSRPRHVIAVVLIGGLVAACGATGDPDLVVGTARASERIGGASQVVVEVTNRGDGDDRLVDATTPAAIGTEIHLTTVDDDGRATMGTVDEVDIPAGETVRFQPGGLHLMLTVPDESVIVGGTFELTLHFDRSGEVAVPVEVVEQHALLEPAADPGDTTDPTDP